MTEINFSMSPMALMEEDPSHTPLESALHKVAVQQILENLRASFLIGSIDQMNEWMNYPLLYQSKDLLVIESMSKRNMEEILKKYSKKEAESIDNLKRTDSEKFPFKSSVTFPRDMIPVSKSTEVSPKLVELQHFPGFKESEPTDLPNQTSLSMVLEKVVTAKSDLKRKPKYKFEFEILLHSHLVRVIILDVFWWLFLHKYQPDSIAQDGFFNRISLNYVNLLIKCQTWFYGDVFLKEFANVLSQATYSCFCCSFPQSWLQFGQNNFKNELCDLVYQWIGGTPPSAGIFLSWNYDFLEPEELKETKSVTKDSTRNRRALSASLVTPAGENTLRSSSSSARRRKKMWLGTKIHSPRVITNNPSVDQLGKMVDNSLCPIDENPSYVMASGSSQENEKANDGRIAANISKWRNKDSKVPYTQSHPLDDGPEFTKSMYNLFGLSPLVQNFLQKYQLEPKSGMNVHVTRTAIKRLPRPGVLTYHDVIEEGFRKLFTLKQVKDNLYQQQIRGLAMFNRKLRAEHEAFKRMQADLQTKKKEVKTVCPFTATRNLWALTSMTSTTTALTLRK